MARGKKDRGIAAYRHPSSKRTNLPTDPDENFMEDGQKAAVSYAPPIRQSGYDPRLSWDRKPALVNLESLAYPLYIHEKIEPSSFINALRGSKQAGLWGDFNGLPEDAAYEWYKHKGNWQNRIVRGDSARIMASLIAKEGMGGKVQMVYYDPPYGISFDKNFQASSRSRDVGTSAKDIPNDLQAIKAFRDTYDNGIHSYLDSIYHNLVLAREMLHDSGNLFLQMGPDNVHRIAVLLDEVFGPENRIATIPFTKSGGTSSSKLPTVADYLLWYAKDKEQSKYFQMYEPLDRQEKLAHMSSYAAVEMPDGTTRPLTDKERQDVSALPKEARLYRRMGLTSMHESKTGRSKDYTWNGKQYKCPPNNQWRVSMEGLDRLAVLGRLDVAPASEMLHWKRYEEEVPGQRLTNLWHEQMSASDLHYIVETAEKAIKRCIIMTTEPGDLVLDITCGSGTTALVAEEWGRRWITTDTSSVAVSLARQRVATATFKYFMLQDSFEGAQKEAACTGKKPPSQSEYSYKQDIAKGFVYDRVPDVSAATLAYDQVKPPILLVDQPFARTGTIRVSSPFTVESDSPFRYVAPQEAGRKTASIALDRRSAIKDALERAGISGREPNSPRLRFSDIIDWAEASDSGSLIAYVGAVANNGDSYAATGKKAAIVIAPDDMTVSATYINKAAEAAVLIPGKISLLVVVAFAFEASVRSKDFEQRGKLKIIKAQANRDLQIGNLKDQDSDHAFVMIGEPDVRVETVGKDKLTVEVLGYDSYDPATGNIHMGGGKDIDCWMLDTDYDGKSFFARDLHFPNKSQDKQILRLKRKLASWLDQEAWDAMLSYKSLPFVRPDSGRIAIRIVTNTHTEMTTVIDCESIK